MTNHAHLIALPGRDDSVSVLMRRVAGAYAQYYNARTGRTGHLWQNRFFGCVLGISHLWKALAYVELNPVRAGMVQQAAQCRWSSAVAHLTGKDDSGLLDMDWWRREAPPNWERILREQEEDEETVRHLRACTYAGRPFGDKEFMKEMGERFGRKWVRGRPRKEGPTASSAEGEQEAQFTLF
jgi:putative transposase